MAPNQKLYCETLGCKMAYSLKGLKRILGKRFTEEDITLTLEQYFLLNILDNEEGLILKELAEIVDRDKSAVLRHIDCLEENHFVARSTDPHDKRRKNLLITKMGMNELQKARRMDEETNKFLVRDIDPEKIKEFENFLTEIYERAMSEEYC